jgi:hypothetical protein
VWDSDVEAEVDDIPVGDHVLLALGTKPTGVAGSGFRAKAIKVVVGDDLCTDEAAFEVGVDRAGRSRCRGTGGNGPGPCLLGAGREERQQPEQAIGLVDQALQAAAFQAEGFEVLGPAVVIQVGQFGFDLRADDNDLGTFRLGDLADDVDVLVAVRQVILADVGGVQDRLASEERQFRDAGWRCRCRPSRRCGRVRPCPGGPAVG